MNQTSNPPSNGSNNDPVDLASGNLKIDQALRWQTHQRGQRFLQSISNAEAKAAYDQDYQPPEGEDVIAIESPNTTTINHNYAPPPTTNGAVPQSSWPNWARIVAVGAGLITAGGGGALVANIFAGRNQTQALGVQTKPSPSSSGLRYALDFWDPEELTQTPPVNPGS